MGRSTKREQRHKATVRSYKSVTNRNLTDNKQNVCNLIYTSFSLNFYYSITCSLLLYATYLLLCRQYIKTVILLLMLSVHVVPKHYSTLQPTVVTLQAIFAWD